MSRGQQQRGQLPPPRGNGNQQQNDAKEEGKRAFEQLRLQLNNDEFRNRCAAALPRLFRSEGYVERLCESIFTACRDNPKLLTDCDRASLFKSAEQVAKRGLTVGDNVAWLVPYAGQVQYQLGYRGAIIICKRVIPKANFSTASVFENDLIKIRLGTQREIIHEVDMRQPRGQVIGCYATVNIDDWNEVEPADLELIDYVRSKSPSKNSPAWTDWYEEHIRKIPLKRLCKRLPNESIDLADMDDRTIEGTAEVLGIRQNSNLLTQSAETPMDPIRTEQPREKEPAKTQGSQEEPQQQKTAQATETVDADGVVTTKPAGAGQGGSAPQDEPQQQDNGGGRRRGGGRGGNNGSLAFPED